ncbi:MAG TPA: biotin-dependent carboxyltransferase family protein [Candidatus Polarisedimenticolaceae bacterium]|nr:biotin-dependent carboxyltransferase family protein [Candidatus Polarisedimenticolaceae bacterium]
MRQIRVLAPGFLTTVQDLGRFGHGEEGVSAAGAADPLALRVGNRLLGNPEGAPALEMTLTGGTFAFDSGGEAVLSGSHFGATLDGIPVAPWICFQARPGQTLVVGPTREGARAYLCVRGGIDVPRVLGSASTHLLTGIGGVEGRPLRTGDRLVLGPEPAAPVRPVDLDRLHALRGRGPVRFTPGPQADWFEPEAHVRLATAGWSVLEGSDRTGLRLDGPSLPRRVMEELPTEGAPLGAIQVPRDGGPIVLFVDHQTTGGYPRIGNVIAVDLARLGQLRPRDIVRLQPVDFEQARELLLRQEEAIVALVV